VKLIKDDILVQVISELMEQVSPDREERVYQAIVDVKKDISDKQKRFREITAKMNKVGGLISSLVEQNGADPVAQLAVLTLKKRLDDLEEEADGINLSKMVKKLGLLERELDEIQTNQVLIESIKGALNG